MTKFNFSDYTTFVTDYSVKNGTLVDEFTLNLSPQRIKKEIDNLYNVLNILNGNELLNWSPIEEYLAGELCQNKIVDGKIYRARKNSAGKRPDLFPDFWEIAKDSDYTRFGGFTNFLAKDNTNPYHPINKYNPATKGYVDLENAKKLNINGKAADSALLNGEAVTNVLSNSTTTPASVNLVNDVNNKIDKILTPNGISTSENINARSCSLSNTNLAEMYSVKKTYPIGSLVQISTSDSYDIEENVNDVFGVIADKPGIILDDGINGQPVTMIGKTSVIIEGIINKGDKITASGSVAKKALVNEKVIGIALGTKTTNNNALVKCFVQIQLESNRLPFQ